MREKKLVLENKLETSENSSLEKLLEKLFDSQKLIKTNEGHKGVILELNLNDLSVKDREIFFEYFQITFNKDNKNEDVAFKILKVYRATEAEKEFTIQKKAAQVINSQKNLQGKVKIPECYFGGEIEIRSKSLQEKFKKNKINVTSDNKLGLIMMDFIKGQDLGMFCYKEFIKKNFNQYKELMGISQEREIKPEEYDLYLKNYSIDELILICHRILGIEAKYHFLDESLAAHQERDYIANKIINPIENQGLFDKTKLTSLKEAIEIMHQHGIYHRDLHLRNIILANDGSLAIVDFGSAVFLENYQEVEIKEIYKTDEGKIMQQDEAILNFLNRLATTPQEAEERRSLIYLSSALRIKEMIINSLNKEEKLRNNHEKKAVMAWNNLQKNLTEGKNIEEILKNFNYDFGKFVKGEEMYNYHLAGLMILLEQGQAELVNNFLNEVLNKPETDSLFFNKIQALRTIYHL